MEILALIFLVGIVMGVLVGLFPVLPIWVGPLLLIPFINDLELVHILVFYITVAIGSQFFGSVATLLTGIPGETSALSYSDYVSSMNRGQRLRLINDTAWASMLTSIVTTVVVAVIFTAAGHWLSGLISFKLQWFVLAVCAVLIVLFSEKILASALLLMLGILLSTKNHPDIPYWAVQIQNHTQDTTIFLITLAAVIVPSILTAGEYLSRPITKLTVDDRSLTKDTVKNSAIGGGIGFIIGFMPGPAAMLSSILAFRLPKKKIYSGVVRAESANNAAIITETVPFFGLGIPINTTAVIVFSIISMKLIPWPSGVYQSWHSWPVYVWVFVCAALASVVFFWLSTRFLVQYVKLLDAMGRRIHWLWAMLLVAMIVLDVIINTSSLWYALWLPVMLILGSGLWYYKISGVSLIFGYVLGDRLTWALLQFFEYYT